MHHTIAWRVSSADATAVDQTPVQDILMAIQNGHFMPQQDYMIQYCYVGAAAPNRARFITPSARQITTPWIRPINGAIVPGDEPNIADYRHNPFRIRGLEELQLEAMQTSGGAAVIAATAGLSQGMIGPAPAGDVYSMRGTGATTLTAGGWTSTPITWQDTLPTGLYACVGLEYIGTTALAARLIFEEQWARPGCVGSGSVVNSGLEMFRKGGLGIWGRFNANRMPSIECLANAADTAEEIYLDFVRVG